MLNTYPPKYGGIQHMIDISVLLIGESLGVIYGHSEESDV